MPKFTTDAVAGSTTQRIVVVFENAPAREHALGVCERFARAHHSGPSPEIHWYSFASLDDTRSSYDAAEKTSVADLIVFAIVSGGDFSAEIKLWIERWLAKRTRREGAVAGLVTDRPARAGEVACLKEVYLRHTAHRAGMDYLSQEIPAIQHGIPDSLDSYNQRAGQMTSVLDQILHKHLPAAPQI